ncbi:MAG: HD domain-containing protein [Candidatus Omnitrophica bacterium]|nr:HD domain-containing protein [Candidatus Omnitrophota bacterium]
MLPKYIANKKKKTPHKLSGRTPANLLSDEVKEIIARRAGLTGFFAALAILLFQLITYWPKYPNRGLIYMNIFYMSLFVLLILASTIKPVGRFLFHFISRFFQREREYQRTLRDAAKGMAKVTDMEKLFKLIVYFMNMKMEVAHTSLFYKSKDEAVYRMRSSRGRIEGPSVMERTSPLITWLEEKRDVLAYDELVHWLKQEKLFPRRTVLRKTLDDIRWEMERLKAAVCVPGFSKDRMLGFLVLGEKASREIFTQEDVDALSMVSSEAAVAIENAELYQELYRRLKEIEQLYQNEKRVFYSTAIAFAAAIDAKDPYTHGHTERVTKYCVAIGKQIKDMGVSLDDKFDENLRVSALLHDVGKIGTPDYILNKKGPLTRKEYEEIKKHPVIGASILAPIKELEDVIEAIRYHQEWYNGEGYPEGIKGEEIPLVARIIMAADTFDAMTTDRPYRPRVMDQVAIQEIKDGAGKQFDPLVVEAFTRAYYKGNIVDFEKPEETPKARKTPKPAETISISSSILENWQGKPDLGLAGPSLRFSENVG